MTHKERIEWFLTLQQVVKRSKNHATPPVPILKKQLKQAKLKNLENALVILHQTMLLINHSKALPAAQMTSSSNQDKARTPILNSRLRSAFSMPLAMVKEYHTQPKASQLATKLDHRYSVIPTIRHELKRYWTSVEQLSAIQKPLSTTMAGRVSTTKKTLAPKNFYLSSPMYANNDQIKATILPDHSNIKLTHITQQSQVNKLVHEHSSSNNLNTTTIQKRDTAVDQYQSSVGSNAFASMLYLDGASLGRWATQHLERVLSKPPSGMTGVDPRATVPRGRVGPF